MGRLGFLWQADGDNGAVLNQIEELCALPGLEAEGIFTHFSDADGDERYTRAQLDRFIEARAALEKRGVRFQVSHCGASAAVLHYPCTHMDMVRPGIALYGYYPASWLEGPDSPELRPVMTLKSRVCAVRSLPAGSCISYGRTAVLERDSRVAVVPIGYGDGYPRVLSNRMEMEVRGMRCPVLGRVCMDMCMLDVTDVPGAAEGDTAVAYGPGLNWSRRPDWRTPLSMSCSPAFLPGFPASMWRVWEKGGLFPKKRKFGGTSLGVQPVPGRDWRHSPGIGWPGAAECRRRPPGRKGAAGVRPGRKSGGLQRENQV